MISRSSAASQVASSGRSRSKDWRRSGWKTMWSAATLMSIEFMESSKYTARAALRAWLCAARRCMYRPTNSQPDAPKNAPIAAEINCSKLIGAVSGLLLQGARSAQHEVCERNQLVLGRRRRRQRDRQHQLARAHEDG